MAKKNIFLKIATFMIFAFAPVLLLLSACGSKAPKYFYFTVDALPAHVSEVNVTNTNGGEYSDEKGKFLEKGEVAQITIYIEEGYTLGTLKVLSNGEELTLTEDGEYCYKATFEPTEDFAITFTGAVAPKTSFIRLSVGSMYSGYHDRIMVEIDRYDLFGLEKETMTFAEFKEAVANAGYSVYQVDYNTQIAISVYTVGEYDFAISGPICVQILNGSHFTGIGYTDNVEKIVDEENQKYGYKHTLRFYEDNTITINDEVLNEYRIDFIHDWDNISMNKDLFALSVNGEDRAVASSYEYIQGVIKFSDFTGTELPKLKIEFLKYGDENYRNFYDALTFDLAGTSAQKSADGSYVEIEFDKYYNYDFEHDRYIVSTNVLELLKAMDMVVGRSSLIVEEIKLNGIEDSSQYENIYVADLLKDKCLGRTNESLVYFFKDEVLTFTIDFYSEVDFEYVRFGDVLVKINDNSNPDVVVTKTQYDYLEETPASRITITVKATVATETIEFFTNNPRV